MTEEYRYERLTETNIGDLLPLYLDAFHEVRTLEKVKAKFDTAVFGVQNLAFIAYAKDNTAAAFYALFPVTMVKNERKILAAQVGDLMTHSNHRRKGLYITLANMTHEVAKKEGVELIFTVPYGENASYLGFVNRLSFVRTHDLNGYFVKVNTLPLAGVLAKFPVVEQLYYKAVRKIVALFFARKEQFDNQITPVYAEVAKDKLFFDYKRGYSETYVLKIAGIGVWLKFHRGAIKIGDVEKLSGENFTQLISGLKKIAFLFGFRIIQFETSPGTYLDEQLRTFDTPVNNYRICILNFSNLADNDYKFTFADLDNF